MLTEEQKIFARGLRHEGFTYEYIGSIIGCSASTAQNIASDVRTRGDYTAKCQDPAVTRRIISDARRKAKIIVEQQNKDTMKPCEHCRWRLNKSEAPVCVVCYREIFA